MFYERLCRVVKELLQVRYHRILRRDEAVLDLLCFFHRRSRRSAVIIFIIFQNCSCGQQDAVRRRPYSFILYACSTEDLTSLHIAAEEYYLMSQ